MPKSENQKLKILYVADYFRKELGEGSAAAVKDIIDYLEDNYGIEAERHSIYRDIALLRDYYDGLEIEGKKGGYYYLVNPDVSIENLQLVKDAVAAMPCISEDTAEELNKKLEDALGAKKAASEYKNVEVIMPERAKVTDAVLLNNVNQIKKAISKNHQISFKYLKYNIRNMPKQTARRRGTRYKVSPFQLFINNGKYYLLGYTETTDRIDTYRVDRMKDIEINNQLPREGAEKFAEIDVKAHIRASFGMFGGTYQEVQMEFANKLIDVVVDKLGTDSNVKYEPQERQWFTVTTKLEISSQFYAWICGFGSNARILSPENVVQGMKDFLNKVCVLYESGEE